MALKGKQRLFALAYVGKAKFNATLAVKMAGYTYKNDATYRVIGHKLLTRVNIANEIEKLTRQRLHDEGFTDSRVTKEIIDIAFTNPTDFQDESGNIKINKETQPVAALKEIKEGTLGKDMWTIEVKLHDKLKALEMLSKLLNMKSGETPIVLREQAEQAREKIINALTGKEHTEGG